MTVLSERFFDDYELEELNEEVIENAEKVLKVKLPKSYINLMKKKNGSELDLREFSFEGLEEGSITVDYLLGIGLKRGEGILTSPYMIKEWGLPRNIVLLNGDGHNWIALDYRKDKGDKPSVIYLDGEQDKEFKIAKDFEAFIGNLTFTEKVREDKNELAEAFSIEELEEGIQKQNPYITTAGLFYYGMIECDLEWFLNEVEKAVKIPDEYVVREVVDALVEKIKNSEIELNEFPQITSILATLSNHSDDVSGVLRRRGKKIEEYFLRDTTT